MERIVGLCKEEGMPYYILGNGSNLLVGDKGYHGVIIQICKEMNEISVEDNFLNVQAGALLSRVGNVALEAGLAGFEVCIRHPRNDGRRCVYEMQEPMAER